MYESVSLIISESSQVGAARREATAAARALGFDETQRGQLALIITEIGNNIVQHAGSGELILRFLDVNGEAGIEITALDKGAGMANIRQCLIDGYSTAGTPGNGMGAIFRLSSHLDIYSLPGRGTVLQVLFPLRSRPLCTSLMQIGVINRPKPREEVCGDSWTSVHLPGRTLFFLADGLGHGPEARTASQDAVHVFQRHSERRPHELLEAIHSAISGTRGVAAAIAEVQHQEGRVCFAGIGNIAGTIITGDKSQSVVSHNGIVGHRIHKIQEFLYPWSPESLLILHSDGVGSRWRLDSYPGLSVRHPSLIAGVLYRDFQRETDDSTILVARVRPQNEEAG